jgi:hypothetical protein
MRGGKERIVDVELVLDLGVGRDALDAAHLLDLEEHGVAILEDKGEVRAHRHPPPALQLDHALAHGRAHLLVLEEVQNVVLRNYSHLQKSAYTPSLEAVKPFAGRKLWLLRPCCLG